MPRRKRTSARRLDWRQEWELSFAWGGQCTHQLGRENCTGIGCWSAFESEEEREEAYWANRERLLRLCAPLVRPAAWWHYEAPSVCRHEPRCAIPRDTAARDAWLEAHDQLSPREIAARRREEASEQPQAEGGAE